MNSMFCVFFMTLIFGNMQIHGEEDSEMNINEIVKKNGYPLEAYEIETADGYILTVHRIPYNRRSRTKRANKYPVILNHGLLGSAENFLIIGPKKSLAYMLADHGYDVWLCNARGTWHSRKHKTLNPDKDAKFWKFTWNEIGVYDLPATIDFVLNTTNSNKLHFVGHSQGTTTFFVMCSEYPEYNEKIKVMIALAPSAVPLHFKEPFLKMLAPYYTALEKLSEDLRIYELLPFVSNKRIRNLGKALCSKNNSVLFNICHMIVLLFSQDSELDRDAISLTLSTVPGGGSVKQALHYAQVYVSGKFRKYDWGPEENIRRYNARIPPEYNLNNVTAPVALFYGEADRFTPKEDVEILGKLLPNVVEMYCVPLKKWTHMDFLWAKDLLVVNYKVIHVLKKFDTK